VAIEFEEIPALDGGDGPNVANDAGTEEPPKRKRGRPRSAEGSAPRTPRVTAADRKNIDAALATMQSVYTMMGMGLLAMGKPSTAAAMDIKDPSGKSAIDQWQDGNRQAFTASPALAARIASAGQVSGTLIFAITNIGAAITVASAIREEGAAQRAARAARAEQNNPAPDPTTAGFGG